MKAVELAASQRLLAKHRPLHQQPRCWCKRHSTPRPPHPRAASFWRLYRKRTPEVEANRNRRNVRFRYSTSVNRQQSW